MRESFPGEKIKPGSKLYKRCLKAEKRKKRFSGTTHANESVEVREQRGKGSGVASRTSSLSTEPWETMLGGAAQLWTAKKCQQVCSVSSKSLHKVNLTNFKKHLNGNQLMAEKPREKLLQIETKYK